MKIEIDLTKSYYEILASYYDKLKHLKKKRERLLEHIEQTKKKMKKENKEEETVKLRTFREKHWFEKFHFSFTKSGLLMIGGRSAQQNDHLFNHYLEPNDLFFHADIPGGGVVIIKKGKEATQEERAEAAQLAGCFSRAWREGLHAVDVYCVPPEAVSKKDSGVYSTKGSFVIKGERGWFKNMPLRLRMGFYEYNGERLLCVFAAFSRRGKVELTPGQMAKGEAIKKLSKIFDVHPDEVMPLLPPGKVSYSLVKE